jgi:hypothetical protein
VGGEEGEEEGGEGGLDPPAAPAAAAAAAAAVLPVVEADKEEEGGGGVSVPAPARDAYFDESHDQDRCTVLFKSVPETGDVLVAHTTFDYYVAAWQRLVKDVVLPVLPPRVGKEEEEEVLMDGLVGRKQLQEQQQAEQQQQQQQQQRTRLLFSASAGQVASLDDFYVIRGEVRVCVGVDWVDGWMDV